MLPVLEPAQSLEAELTIVRAKPADTKLIVCVWHPFPQWRADEMMPAAIRKRWPEMRVVHLPDYDRLTMNSPTPTSSSAHPFAPTNSPSPKN